MRVSARAGCARPTLCLDATMSSRRPHTRTKEAPGTVLSHRRRSNPPPYASPACPICDMQEEKACLTLPSHPYLPEVIGRCCVWPGWAERGSSCRTFAPLRSAIVGLCEHDPC